MQGPTGDVGVAVERIMSRIRIHLQPDDPGSALHYNRTFEAVADELERFKILLTTYRAALRDRA